MVFSSMYFIFIFLPFVLLSYFLLKILFPSKIFYRNVLLCFCSLFFYAWGEPIYILLMLFSIICNFFFAKSTKKSVYVIAILFNLIFLFFFKYTGFFIQNINKLFSVNIKIPQLTLPIGISFYTFQALSYIIDVHRKKVEPQNNIISLAVYISLFPQLIAGPIVRYTDIEKELSVREDNFENLIKGLKDFSIGLGCKILIANNLAVVADNVLDSPLDACTGIVWFAAIAYSLQIYFDFYGYSRMAIGLGKMFGFNFPENFNYPYCASSITDFWRRWHITLSGWFRDYLYIPLGGNRVSVIKHIRNILITWLFTGFWHGASWNFIFWGLYYGILLLIEKYGTFKILEKVKGKKIAGKMFCVGLRVAAIFLIVIGWVLFRTEDLSQMVIIFKKMFFFDKVSTLSFISQHADTCSKLIFLLPGILFSFPIYKKIFSTDKKGQKKSDILFILELLFSFLILIISICFLEASTYNPFIYFRF